MSVGQYLPHPLDSVSDVLGQLHAFHVHCVLVDIWNYMRDNVPSPVAYSATAAGSGKGGTAKGGYRWGQLPFLLFALIQDYFHDVFMSFPEKFIFCLLRDFIYHQSLDMK